MRGDAAWDFAQHQPGSFMCVFICSCTILPSVLCVHVVCLHSRLTQKTFPDTCASELRVAHNCRKTLWLHVFFVSCIYPSLYTMIHTTLRMCVRHVCMYVCIYIYICTYDMCICHVHMIYVRGIYIYDINKYIHITYIYIYTHIYVSTCISETWIFMSSRVPIMLWRDLLLCLSAVCKRRAIRRKRKLMFLVCIHTCMCMHTCIHTLYDHTFKDSMWNEVYTTHFLRFAQNSCFGMFAEFMLWYVRRIHALVCSQNSCFGMFARMFTTHISFQKHLLWTSTNCAQFSCRYLNAAMRITMNVYIYIYIYMYMCIHAHTGNIIRHTSPHTYALIYIRAVEGRQSARQRHPDIHARR